MKKPNHYATNLLRSTLRRSHDPLSPVPPSPPPEGRVASAADCAEYRQHRPPLRGDGDGAAPRAADGVRAVGSSTQAQRDGLLAAAEADPARRQRRLLRRARRDAILALLHESVAKLLGCRIHPR